MKEKTPYSLGSQLIVAALFAVIGLAVLYTFVVVVEPPLRTHQPPFRQDYSEQPLADLLAGNGFEKRLAQIAAAGGASGERQVGRLSGSPGFYRAESLILDAFRQAGLEIQTQEFQVVVPVTERCEIVGEDGNPLKDVQIYPFTPAGLLPVALPGNGIKARLVQTEGSALKYLAGNRPEDTIVLTYLDSGGDWASLASAGVRAVIVRDDELSRAMRPSPDVPGAWPNMVTNQEVSFPRFLARGPIEKYANQTVTLQCKVTWQSRKVRNLIGALRAKTPSKEALVLTGFYDSNSVVPDLAPGAEQSVSMAALLEYVQALSLYRDTLRRDVIFVATAGHAQAVGGVCKLMEAIEEFSRARNDYVPPEDQLAREKLRRGYAERALKTTAEMDELGGKIRELRERGARESRDVSQDIAAVSSRWKLTWLSEGRDYREWFENCFKTVAGEINLDRKDVALEAKLRYQREGSPVFRVGFDPKAATDEQRKDPANSHPLLVAYMEAKKLDNRSANFMQLPIWDLIEREEFRGWDYAGRAGRYFQSILEYHTDQTKELDDLIAVRRLFGQYRQRLTVNLELCSGGSKQLKDLCVFVGIGELGTTVEPQVSEIANTLLEKTPQVNGEPVFRTVSWGPKDATGSAERPNRNGGAYTELESQVWYLCGQQAFTVVNYEFFPPKVWTPEDTLDGLQMNVLREQIPVIGKTLLAMAHGRVPFKAIPSDKDRSISTFHGAVVGNAGVTAMVPNHPMAERTFVHVYPPNRRDIIDCYARGVRISPVLQTNPYGEYSRKFAFNVGGYGVVNADAARFDKDGNVIYVKDASMASQAMLKSESFPGGDIAASAGQAPKPIRVALFRSTPVALYDRINPQTLKGFKGVSFLSKAGLSQPARSYQSAYTTFLEPDTLFYMGFLDGAAENPEIQTYRAFMLNVDPEEKIGEEEPELHGRGYLAADSPTITYPHIDMAASMLRTGEKRLALQKQYRMADEQMLSFHTRAGEWLADARDRRARQDPAGAVVAAGTSVAYAINNHPVIRSRISHAVVGILWYLGLLVPFVFFCEKLICGFTDIRKQLLATGVIFAVIFGLLRIFHPAFQMVRSSLVILLGFIILLLTVMVTLMVGGKFRQNVKDLRNKEGRVEGADISRSGVTGTAFLLGLNNMRRRKVRTGLTCVTLILITFVMICFTSVSTDLVNIEYATGRSPWNGIMLRDANFVGIDAAQVSNIQKIYGERYPVTTWQWLCGSKRAGSVKNTEILIDRAFTVGGNKIVKRGMVSAAIQMEWLEPMFSGIDRFLLTNKTWFPRPPVTRQERLDALKNGYKAKNCVILPDNVARSLDVKAEDVNKGGAKVSIRGEEYEVLGIIDSLELTKCLGPDGQSILPYDLNSVQNLGATSADVVLVPEDIKRLPGSQVIIVNRLPQGTAGPADVLPVACGILFPRTPYRVLESGPEQPGVDYKQQRKLVDEFLERTGESAYYSIDGVSYYGSRMRAKSVAGLLELLVPILIASLTVFNTMRGSVYERREEIYVYNAVGIAPNHVFFIFMAEACVFAVMGAMLGYLLSQGSGRLLTMFHLTGGLNMDYSSIETIYASLAIVAAVLLSTILPARDAAKLASPSGSATWTMPVAEGDTMQFNLPFTFTPRDRVAVVSYFYRWLDANGAGSSGPFYCAPPEPLVKEDASEERSGGLIPAICSTVWLKPYDLGVSQRIEISLPTDPETGEYIANVKLVRLSGNVAAWNRTVKPFLGMLRKQFLNWRVTGETERKEMFEEARRILSESVSKEKSHA